LHRQTLLQLGENIVPKSTDKPRAAPAATTKVTEQHIALGTHFFNQRYLYAVATQGEVTQHIRTQTAVEESERLPEILAAWQTLQPSVQQLVQAEAGLADTQAPEAIGNEHASVLQAIRENELFQKSFSMLPHTFGIVDIDKLVAAQRSVNLDYVDRLRKQYEGKTSVAALIDICLSPTRDMPPVQQFETPNNTHVFTSPNSDVRFLGSFLKKLTPEDASFAVAGGLPVAATIAFVGYGASSVNVLHCDNRIILNNGFHRVYALRSMNITKIPVVIQRVSNFQLEFPPAVSGLPREYLMGHPRPVLMKDFLRDNFSISLKAKDRVKVIMVQAGAQQFDAPA